LNGNQHWHIAAHEGHLAAQRALAML
jgi:hypothetical protein